MGRLDVRLKEAINLPDTQTFGTPSPYVSIYVEHHKDAAVTSATKDKTLNPIWSDLFKMDVPTNLLNGCEICSKTLILEIWNSNMVKDDKMGVVRIDLSELKEGVVDESWFVIDCSCSGCDFSDKDEKEKPQLRVRAAAQNFGINDEKMAKHLAVSMNDSTSSAPFQTQNSAPVIGNAQQPPVLTSTSSAPQYQPHQQQHHHQYPPNMAYPPPQHQYPPPQQQQQRPRANTNFAAPPPQQQQQPYPNAYPPQQQQQQPYPNAYPPQQHHQQRPHATSTGPGGYPPAAGGPPRNLGYPVYSQPAPNHQQSANIGGQNFYNVPPPQQQQQQQQPQRGGYGRGGRGGYPPQQAQGLPPQMY